jgi:protein gp37
MTGCTKTSPGCANCYAERLHTMRHKAHAQGKAVPDCYTKPFGTVQLHADRLHQPMHWRRPRGVFVCSMGDLFHEDVPTAFLDRVFAVMALCPQHTFMLLTKRGERMQHYLSSEPESAINDAAAAFAMYDDMPDVEWPLPNVGLGVTVEDQPRAEQRIPVLLDTPAAFRFVSVEPMLGAVDLRSSLDTCWWRCRTCGTEALAIMDSPTCDCIPPDYAEDGEPVADWVNLPALDWVICGGETGPGARPMYPDWARSLRDQCADAGVPFFLKQMGGPGRDHGGRLLDGREHSEFPEVKP